jgi:uncharacterized membrane protein SirB2
MYTGMLHTHKLSVMLFLVLYLFKLIFLLTNNQRGQDALRKKGWRIFDMSVSTLFLLTGIYMLIASPQIKTLVWVKLGMVLVAIPLAIVGFKKANKPLAVLSVVMIFGVYGLAEVAKKQLVKVDNSQIDAAATPELRAAALYTNNCIQCHGADGALGINGAANLQTSKISESEIADILLNGKNAMGSYKAIPEADRKLLVAHVLTLRK